MEIRSITTFGFDAFSQVFISGSTTVLCSALFVGDSINLNLGTEDYGLQFPSQPTSLTL